MGQALQWCACFTSRHAAIITTADMESICIEVLLFVVLSPQNHPALVHASFIHPFHPVCFGIFLLAD